jgi:dolichol-phosphate mannosyltransferase
VTERPPDISIIVPTLNEAGNLSELARRLHASMAGRAYELLVVDDDSRDGTPDVCRGLAREYPLTLHVRRTFEGGLSGAVLYGFRRARGGVLAVMDADLQHPPERLPALLRPVLLGEADFVLGSRYAPGGSVRAGWRVFRRLNSAVATLLARPFARQVRDPMTGFFVLRRELYERARELDPLGYKIALELLCKCPHTRVLEVPIRFESRANGHSKLSLAQQRDYLKHIARLYQFRYPRLLQVRRLLAAGAPPVRTPPKNGDSAGGADRLCLSDAPSVREYK